MEEWVKKFKKKGVEIKRFGNNYYAYHSTTKWDKKNKRRVKVSKYIGKVTPKGIIRPNDPKVTGIYEYGNVSLLYNLANKSGLTKSLRRVFDKKWKDILAFSITRTIYPLPLKSVRSYAEKTYLSKKFRLHLSPKSLSKLLVTVGKDYRSQLIFFKTLIESDSTLLYDLSFIFSTSQTLTFAEKGYNKDHLFLPQINIALGFSHEKKIPMFIKILPGSVRDVSTLVGVVREFELKDVTLVLDRGFFSKPNVDYLRKERLKFVMPTRRNSTLIPYHLTPKDFFMYRGRAVKWVKKKVGKIYVYLYEDIKLRYEEENTYYSRVDEGKKKFDDKNVVKFGKIALISNIDAHPQDIYLMFKFRDEIEYAINVFKNLLEADKTYLRDTDSLRGYVFINFISLHLYYLLLNKLQKLGINSKVSVKDVLLELSKVYVVETPRGEILSEIPKKVRDLIGILGLDLFPKIRES